MCRWDPFIPCQLKLHAHLQRGGLRGAEAEHGADGGVCGMRGCEDRGRGRAGLKGEREHVRDAHRSGRDALASLL